MTLIEIASLFTLAIAWTTATIYRTTFLLKQIQAGKKLATISGCYDSGNNNPASQPIISITQLTTKD